MKLILTAVASKSLHYTIFFSLWLKIRHYKEEILIEFDTQTFLSDRAAALLKSVVYYKIMHKWTLQKWALKAHYLSKDYLSICRTKRTKEHHENVLRINQLGYCTLAL